MVPCVPEVEEREGVVSPPPQTALSGGCSAPAGLRHSAAPRCSSSSSGSFHTPPIGCVLPVLEADTHLCVCGSFFSSARTRPHTRLSGSQRAKGSSLAPTLNNPAIPHRQSPQQSALTGGRPGREAATKLINKQAVGGGAGSSRCLRLLVRFYLFYVLIGV